MFFFAVVVLAAVARLLLFGLKSALAPSRPSRGKPFSRFRYDVTIAAAVTLAMFAVTVSQTSRYRRKPKTSEVKSNLGAIRSTEVAFFAEWYYWVGNQPCTPVLNRAGRKEAVPWNGTTRFSILGFAPEGRVYCSYCLEGSDYPAETVGFTARAECDLDGDGGISVYWITSNGTEIWHTGSPF